MTNKYKLYIRRLKRTDKSDSFFISIRLGFFLLSGTKAYVLLQRKCPINVLAVYRTKKEVKECWAQGGRASRFNEVANKIKGWQQIITP